MTVAMRRIILLIAGVLVLSSALVKVLSGDDARRPAGKQWPAVFVPALRQNRFPSKRHGGLSVWHVIPESAVANADQNPDIDVDNLGVRNVMADQGPTMKRWRARARGRGTRILKRTSHITVILTEETP